MNLRKIFTVRTGGEMCIRDSSQSGVNPLATFEGDGGTVKLDHIGSGILRWQVLPDKIANNPFSLA